MSTLALLIFLVACLFISAQGEAPIPATAPAYETVDERTLYVQGGITEMVTTLTVTNQLFALDFTTNWTSSNPPWRSVTVSSAMGAPKAWGHSMVYDKASNSLVLWSTAAEGGSAIGLTTFSISNNSWAPSNALLSEGLSMWFKLRSATDPRTGLIYVPSGKNNGTEMAVYGASGSSGPKVMMPPANIMTAGVYLAAVVWSTQRNSLLIYGGRSYWEPTAMNPYLVEYSPQTSKWKRLATNGTSPGSLVSHCMVPAYNGTKMIVFGGALYPEVVTRVNGDIPLATIVGSIYILDVQSLIWTKGADADPQYVRSDMACGVSGDNFVAWGGEVHSRFIDLLGTPIIYNMKTNIWSEEFVQTLNLKSDEIPSITTASTATPTAGSTVRSVEGTDTRVIARSAGAAIAAILVAALVYVCYKSRHRLALYSRVNQGRNPQQPSVMSEAQEDRQRVSPLKQQPQWPPFATGYQLRAPAGLPPHSTSAANVNASPYPQSYDKSTNTFSKSHELSWAVNPFQPHAPEVHANGLYRGLEEQGFKQHLMDIAAIGGQISQAPDRSSIQLLGHLYNHESHSATSNSLDQGIEQQLAFLEAKRLQQYQEQLTSLQRLRQEHEEQLQALRRQLQSRPSSMTTAK